MILPGAGLASPTGRMDIVQGSGGYGTLSQRLHYLPVSPHSPFCFYLLPYPRVCALQQSRP